MDNKTQNAVYNRLLKDLKLLKNSIIVVQVILVLVLIFQATLTLILIQRLP